jgi:hypothetical protein
VSPGSPSHDPFASFPDVLQALATAVPPVAPPARLKERLDARLAEFTREREASFHLLSRPADLLRDRVCRSERRGPERRRPLGRVVVSADGREAAFFCWYLPPRKRFDLVFERGDGTLFPCACIETDSAGDGELPYLALPPGSPLAGVALRCADSGETVLAARL